MTEQKIPVNFRPDQLAQETRLQKLAYWLLCVQDEAL